MPARHVVTLFRILLQSRSVPVNPALITHFSIALSSASDYDHKGTSHGDSAWVGTEELCNRLHLWHINRPERWTGTNAIVSYVGTGNKISNEAGAKASG